MSEGVRYWTSVAKKIFFVFLAALCVGLAFKLAVFYMPFLIAFIISLIMEPFIKWIMKKFKVSRKISSILVFIITFGVIIAILSFGIGTLISESTNLLDRFNDYYENISNRMNDIIKSIDFSKIKIPGEILKITQDTSSTILEKTSGLIQKFLISFLNMITSIPTFGIYFGITIISLYFICTDKIYILDEMEHHLPDTWMKKISKHLREIIRTLGGYLKAQVKLVLISFVICLIRFIYFLFLRIKCRLSSYDCSGYWLYRCITYFRIR